MQEVLTLARNELQDLDNANLSGINSLRVSESVLVLSCNPPTSLKILNANHNDIDDSGVPSDIFTIRDLVTLDLSHNKLCHVPEDLSKARNIIVLSLSHNNISSVPGAVSMQNSATLAHLTLLMAA